MTANQLLLRQLNYDKMIIKQLTKFYDATNDTLAQQKISHHDSWQKVQIIADKIEADFDLSEYRM